MTDLPEHVARNRAYWDEKASDYVEVGRRNWASEEPTWGLFSVPESEVGMLPREIEGRDSIELGCGTGYVSAWLARRGARPVGIDNSEAQLATARTFQEEFGLDFPLLKGNAEEVPYPDGSFDIAISEYGASIWCDPYAWIPEAARLLRPGGELIILTRVSADAGMRRFIETRLQPVVRPLGFRTAEFAWSRYAQWLSGADRIELAERRLIPPFGHFSLVRFRKTEPTAAVA